MAKETKILMGGAAFLILLIVGFAFLLGKDTTPSKETSSEETTVLGLELTPSFYDLGKVPINGGIVTKDYQVKNTFGKSLNLKKITTSCMCTTASVSVGDKTTKFFGMEGHGDKNPPVNLEVPEGETVKVTVNFDPAAHGPQGTGPFDRFVWLSFSDPAGVEELKFSGEVVSQ